ncbi:MAG: hypothetical protein WDN30_04910 [Pararobbsia sp.]
MTEEFHESSDYDNGESWKIKPYETLVFVAHGEKNTPTLIDNDETISANVDFITQFVKNLIKSKRPLLSLESFSYGNQRRPNTQRIKSSRGGDCFLRCLQIDLESIIDKYPTIGTHNRYFGIFCDAVMREVSFPTATISLATVARREWLNGVDINFYPDHVLALLVQHCNDAADEIRQRGKSDDFRSWLTEIERQPKTNEGRLLSLVDACLSVNHHLLVLRFDLGYGQRYFDRELSGEMTVSYTEVREHRMALRRYLKRYLKDRLPLRACKGMAFGIKLEYGLDKGYHFHVIVILNGDAVGKDGGITEMICRYWVQVITKGRGGACNCNRRRYKHRGIGSIRRGTDELRILREMVVPYITKVDFYGRMAKPDKHRTFWASHPPKVEAHPKGRKRKDIDAK